MAWATLYITGKPEFKEEVLRNLDNSEVSFLPGSDADENFFLVWIDETLPLRDLKKAIGSKIIFKYRLQFFTSLPHQYTGQQSEKLTPREEAMILAMNDWEDKYLHSA